MIDLFRNTSEYCREVDHFINHGYTAVLSLISDGQSCLLGVLLSVLAIECKNHEFMLTVISGKGI